MAIFDKRHDRNTTALALPDRRGARRHYEAVIQAEVRRLARPLGSRGALPRDLVDNLAWETPAATGEVR